MTARDLVPAVGGDHTVPVPDPIARAYVLLALRLDQHMPGLVDAYFGPRDLKAQVDMENPASPSRLAAEASALRARVASDVGELDRRRWLQCQLVALETHASRLTGATIPYVEEVTRYLDAAPEPMAADTGVEVRRDLEGLLPGLGNLAERLAGWDARFVVRPDRVRGVVDVLLPGIREASMARFPAPEGESIRVNLVTGHPWSGYNWYDGRFRSRVDLNLDLPIRPAALIEVLAHETYPGHHLEHAWKERHLVQDLGRVEATVLLLNAPECYVSEGLAELGASFTLDTGTRAGLLREACRAAGLPASDEEVTRQLAIRLSLRRLRGADGTAALMLHAEGRPRDEVQEFLREEALLSPEHAAKRLEFITHPLSRAYVFCYAGGEALLRDWCFLAGAGDAEPARARFRRLLTEQLTPSGIAAELAGAPAQRDATYAAPATSTTSSTSNGPTIPPK
ncbi:MAG TPA: hypothetical protein VN800_00080 [Candidatus Acidoferrales bacterium]|nr:hypothetical protein [Candidatus Acidoferrales bacterium]